MASDARGRRRRAGLRACRGPAAVPEARPLGAASDPPAAAKSVRPAAMSEVSSAYCVAAKPALHRLALRNRPPRDRRAQVLGPAADRARGSELPATAPGLPRGIDLLGPGPGTRRDRGDDPGPRRGLDRHRPPGQRPTPARRRRPGADPRRPEAFARSGGVPDLAAELSCASDEEVRLQMRANSTDREETPLPGEPAPRETARASLTPPSRGCTALPGHPLHGPAPPGRTTARTAETTRGRT